MLKRAISLLSVPAVLLVFTAPAIAARPAAVAARANAFGIHRLVSDEAGTAAHRDRRLVNAWGLVAGPTTPWWVADNGTNLSTLYDGTGSRLPLVVHVGGAPTGAVFNGTADFVVHDGTASGAALFLFATEAGTIRAWSPAVPSPAPSTRSFTEVNRSGKGAIFKGLAIASTAQGPMLYATDFHNGKVDMFDGSFQQVVRPGAFEDPAIPAGYGPFGIRALGGKIFVTYAKQDAAAEDDVHGAGLGFVDVFNKRGDLLGHVASRGALNAPWGLAWAPAGFGRFGGDLLVGNFGDGRIHAYAWTSSGFEPDGTLRRPDGDPIAIDGLWALAFGNDGPAGPSSSLFFTAGPHEESHGLFGSITAS